MQKIEHFHRADALATLDCQCQARLMIRRLVLCLTLAMTPLYGWSATKPHVINFGKWTSVKWPDASGHKMLDLKVRPLYVDSRLREFTTGIPHEITDRLFVVRRVFRVNDALPGDAAAQWQWQRGSWLLVDRVSGRITQLSLPEFDPFYSTAAWYRDYIAYCGVSEDGKQLYAMVAQVGRRKPILKKQLGEPAGEDAPDSECPPPTWQRAPARVTFQPDESQKLVFTVRGRVIDMTSEPDEEAEE